MMKKTQSFHNAASNGAALRTLLENLALVQHRVIKVFFEEMMKQDIELICTMKS